MTNEEAVSPKAYPIVVKPSPTKTKLVEKRSEAAW
jgi:hypothetical protein